MAERTSSRSVSRRTTPTPSIVPHSPTKRKVRVTRSQSRDISDSEGGPYGVKGRRAAKKAPSEGTDGGVGQSNPKGRKGRPPNQSRALQDLSTVPEDPSIAYPAIQLVEDSDPTEVVKMVEDIHRPLQQDSKSPGGVSAFSGTTARTSRSAQELVELSSEDMLDALPDLSSASDKILSYLMPPEISETTIASITNQLQKKDSRTNKNLRRLGNTFQVQRDIFGGESYIDPNAALRVFLGMRNASDNRAGVWRPDPLLQKANLAVLAPSVLSYPWQNQNDQFIEVLEQSFPLPFMTGFSPPDTLAPGFSALSMQTLQLALEIRTQYVIILLTRLLGQPNFDSDVVLQEVFYQDTKNLKGWDFVSLRSEDMTKELQQTILSRLQHLRQAFTETSLTSFEGRAASIEQLKTTFPWQDFVRQAIIWINLRLHEIEAQVISSGGPEGIAQALNDEIQRKRLAQKSIVDGSTTVDDDDAQIELNYEAPSDTTSEQQQVLLRKPTKANAFKLGQFNPGSPKDREALAHLKRRGADRRALKMSEQTTLPKVRQPAPDVQVAATAVPSTRAVTPQREVNEPAIPSSEPAKIQSERGSGAEQADDWRPQEDDDEHPLERDPYADARRVRAQREKAEAESNKENVADIPGSQSSGPRRLLDRQQNAERIVFESQNSNRQLGQIDEISEDEIFQRQNHVTNIAARRRAKPATKRPASEFASFQGRSPKKTRFEDNVSDVNRDDGSTVATHDEADLTRPSQVDAYLVANAEAKGRQAMQRKKMQTRKAWSEEETGRLIDLIVEHGTSWKLLKDEDTRNGLILESRDQVALKDKARNMKVDYLKAGRFMPENFECIRLSKLQIDRLRDVNIEYDVETGLRVDADADEE